MRHLHFGVATVLGRSNVLDGFCLQCIIIIEKRESTSEKHKGKIANFHYLNFTIVNILVPILTPKHFGHFYVKILLVHLYTKITL